MPAEVSKKITEEKQSLDKSHDNSASLAGAALKSARGQKSAAAFRTISEVADELGVQQHVLRFWETKFSYVNPLKRGGGRRYYRPEDVSLLKAVHKLLYVEGYTIKGVQKLLREAGKKQIISNFADEPDQQKSLPLIEPVNVKVDQHQPQTQKASLNPRQRKALEEVLSELKELRGMIKPSQKQS